MKRKAVSTASGSGKVHDQTTGMEQKQDVTIVTTIRLLDQRAPESPGSALDERDRS